MTKREASQRTLEPLKITCTSSDCENGLHCFRMTRKMKTAGLEGRCRSCGAQLIDWTRLYRCVVADAQHTFAALKVEMFRHHFWHVEIDQRAVNHARRKGTVAMRVAAEKRIRRSVGPAEPRFDGRQTPREGSGNVLYYAQHATASCCRKCIEVWHGIPGGRELTHEEILYLTELAVLYVRERLPLLTIGGEAVPAIRSGKTQTWLSLSR